MGKVQKEYHRTAGDHVERLERRLEARDEELHEARALVASTESKLSDGYAELARTRERIERAEERLRASEEVRREKDRALREARTNFDEAQARIVAISTEVR